MIPWHRVVIPCELIQGPPDSTTLRVIMLQAAQRLADAIDREALAAAFRAYPRVMAL